MPAKLTQYAKIINSWPTHNTVTRSHGIYMRWLIKTCSARMKENRYFQKEKKKRFETGLDLNKCLQSIE